MSKENYRKPFGSYPIPPAQINFRQSYPTTETQVVDGRPMSVRGTGYNYGTSGSLSLPPALNVARLQADRLAKQASVRNPRNMARDIDMARQKRDMQMRILQAQAAQAQQKQQQQLQEMGQQKKQKQDGFQMPSAMSPAGQALGAMAATGLQLSGYSTMPRTLGENLGAIAAAGQQAYSQAQEREQASQLQQLKMDIELAKASKPDLTSAQKNAEAMGLIAGTPEYNNFIMEAVTKPSTVVTGQEIESEFSKAAVKAGFARLAKADESIAQVRDVEQRLDQITKLLSNEEFDTGRLTNLTFPFRQILAESGLLSSEEAQKVSNEEVLRNAIAFIIPRMRVVGSGSTSDKEMAMFERAAPSFANSPQGNRKIAAGMYQMIQYQKSRRSLMDKFFEKNKNLIGFDDYADKMQGDLFGTYRSGVEEDEKRYADDLASGKIKAGGLFFDGKEFMFIK